MITGNVNVRLEPRIRVTIRAADGTEQEVEAVVDSGFNGYMTLPTALLATLGYAPGGLNQINLADGTHGFVPTYSVPILWDGQVVRIAVLDIASPVILVGTGLMRGYEVRIEMEIGGQVSITELP